MTTLTPPYRVLAGRCIVDARDRLVARVEARHAVNTLGMVLYRNEDGTSDPDKLRGLSIAEADFLTHEIARVLTSHERIAAALQALLDWGREHTGPTDLNSPHYLLIEAAQALQGEPPVAAPVVRKPEFVCGACKSHNISGIPSSVYWDIEAGRWEISDCATIEDLQCMDCESSDVQSTDAGVSP